MMMNDNNYYFTQLTTLDMTRRIRASEPLDSVGIFCLLLFLCKTNTNPLPRGAQFTWQFSLHVLHRGTNDVET